MSERLRAIVERINVQPEDRVLEIGCGQGVAATLICQRLGGGRLTAIDRSPKMIAAAERRNADFVASGKAEFLLAELESIDLGELRFDKVLAVRVGLFHIQPERAHRLAEAWLAPSGQVFSFFDPPRRADT
jgi:ubiquinone/menaquinone biosynthesis C-methylase UbiE